jgi:hypothetical protein
MKLKDFFETVPPYQEVEIEDINIMLDDNGRKTYKVNTPDLLIHCEKCGGERFFRIMYPPTLIDDQLIEYPYVCKNCNDSKKYFTLLGKRLSKEDHLKYNLLKVGEYPIFGPSTPSKLISLIGPDKENFLKGRRCENQGLGIGSYAYYRRVIESQKNRIIDQFLKICELYENNNELINQLELAKKEIQFSKAIDLIKQNLPSSLLINGHNPLKLIHTALSKGIHEMTDEECLARANSVRIVLTELCLRMNELLKDDKELKNAINILLNPDQEPPHA